MSPRGTVLIKGPVSVARHTSRVDQHKCAIAQRLPERLEGYQSRLLPRRVPQPSNIPWGPLAGVSTTQRVWRNEESALLEMKQECRDVEVRPSILHAEVPHQPGREAWGYILRQNIH